MIINKSRHSFINDSSVNKNIIPKESVNLIVTSPPYPMISMWDETFTNWMPSVGPLLASRNGKDAWRDMNRCLDMVWESCAYWLRPGGFLCINVGDAVRTIGENFGLYPNSSYISCKLMEMGLQQLPGIIWNKPTNAPNKFMGSGVLPAGAYITLEHEHILVFRKLPLRVFTEEEKKIRRQSSIFWHERNEFFSDVWDGIAGTKQTIDGIPKEQRTAAFPFEIPNRLILMYSIMGDTVLDPFAGTCTTSLAALGNNRNSIAIDIDDNLIQYGMKRLLNYENLNEKNKIRLIKQNKNIATRIALNKPSKVCIAHNVNCMSEQEVDIVLPEIKGIDGLGENEIQANYEKCSFKIGS